MAAVLLGVALSSRANGNAQPVDATRLYLSRVLTVEEYDRVVSPGEGEPPISEEQAVEEAWRSVGAVHPSRVVDVYVRWNEDPIWVVSFQGGDICVSIIGPMSARKREAECGGNTWNVRIDAQTGAWLDTYADGKAMTIEQAAAAPPPTLEEFLSSQGG